jgi:hypothetical protein
MALFRIIPLPGTHFQRWNLVCATCGCSATVTGEDLCNAKLLNRLGAEREDGTLSEAEFSQKSEGLEFKVLQRQKTVMTQKVCPECGEKSPGNFASCWSCQAEFAGREASDEADGPDESGELQQRLRGGISLGVSGRGYSRASGGLSKKIEKAEGPEVSDCRSCHSYWSGRVKVNLGVLHHHLHLSPPSCSAPWNRKCRAQTELRRTTCYVFTAV